MVVAFTKPTSAGSSAAAASRSLGATRLFGGLSEQDLECLAARATLRLCRRGELIVSEGAPGDALFVIVEGMVKVFVTSPDGGELVLATLGSAETFGEIAVVDGGARSASVQAVEPSALLVLTRETLFGFLRERPALVDPMLRSLAGLVRRLTDRAADLVFLDLNGRVAKVLCTLCEQRPDGRHTLDLRLTQSEVASMVGGCRQSVNQVLRSLVDRGIVAIRGRQVLVLREDALRRQAGLA